MLLSCTMLVPFGSRTWRGRLCDAYALVTYGNVFLLTPRGRHCPESGLLAEQINLLDTDVLEELQ